MTTTSTNNTTSIFIGSTCKIGLSDSMGCVTGIDGEYVTIAYTDCFGKLRQTRQLANLIEFDDCADDEDWFDEFVPNTLNIPVVCSFEQICGLFRSHGWNDVTAVITECYGCDDIDEYAAYRVRTAYEWLNY